ncbi:MAG: hypothetical protein ACK5CA_05300 [Cyanobacteriota bacterium]
MDADLLINPQRRLFCLSSAERRQRVLTASPLSAACFVSPPPSAVSEFERRPANQSPAPPVLYLQRRAPPVSLDADLLINPHRRLFCISTAACFVSPPTSAAGEFGCRPVNRSSAPPVWYPHRRAPPVSLDADLLINPQRRLFCTSTAERRL